MVTFSDITRLCLQHGSPFYLVDRNRFEANIDALVGAFQSRYTPLICAYSYKTNYVPWLCRLFLDKGGWAEVVSRMEYDMALRSGCDPAKIIFNGPVKSPADLALSLSRGSLVHVDSEVEIEAVLQYAAAHPGRTFPIGIRVNIGLSDTAGQSHIQNGLKIGRFGLDPATIKAHFARADSTSRLRNIKVISLHGHTSTSDRSAWCFTTIAESLVSIARQCFPRTIKYINIGGGMFGYIAPEHRWCEVPSFDEYAEAVCSVLRRDTWVRDRKPTLVIEPGVAVIANAVSFITRVVSVKTVRDKTFVTVDGSALNTKPTFHAVNPPFRIVSARNVTAPVQTFDIVGSTCMEKDVLLNNVTLPLPTAGDFVWLDNVGAYTIVMTPPFINPAPAILVKEQEAFLCVRRRQTLEDVLAGYL